VTEESQEPTVGQPIEVVPKAPTEQHRAVPPWKLVAFFVSVALVFGAAFGFNHASQNKADAAQGKRTAQAELVAQKAAAAQHHDELTTDQAAGQQEHLSVGDPLATATQLNGILATAQPLVTTLVHEGATGASVDLYNSTVDALNHLADEWNSLIQKLQEQNPQ
jgi:hypothetical protein